jgi:hypothetical protein
MPGEARRILLIGQRPQLIYSLDGISAWRSYGTRAEYSAARKFKELPLAVNQGDLLKIFRRVLPRCGHRPKTATRA